MQYILALIALLIFWQPLPAQAWNEAGHMITGAIAYQELARYDAIALERIVTLLKANPID